jgi:hypothetical protein
MHDVCPEEQLLLHVKEHAAAGAIPPHVSGLVHGDVDATYKQLLVVSFAHVASVVVLSH